MNLDDTNVGALRNKVQLIGNVGQPPEIISFDNGNKLAKLSLCTRQTYQNAKGESVEDLQWHQLFCWGPRAEMIEKFVSKGQEIAIEGRLITRSYETKDGEKRYRTEVEIMELLLLGKKEEKEDKTKPEDQTLVEGDRLIREFMGDSNIRVVIPFIYTLGEPLPNSDHDEDCTIHNVKDAVRQELDEDIVNGATASIDIEGYHNSWELLMSVVTDIEEIFCDGEEDETMRTHRFHVDTSWAQCTITDNQTGSVVAQADYGDKRKSVYYAIVEFIKYYNDIKKEKV